MTAATASRGPAAHLSTTSEYGEKYILPLIRPSGALPGISVAYDVNSFTERPGGRKSWTWSCAWATWRTPASKAAGWRLRHRAGGLGRLPAQPSRAQPEDLADLPWIANSNLAHPTAGRCALPAARAWDVVGRAATNPTPPPPSAPWPVSRWVWRCWLRGLWRTTWPGGVLQRVLPDHALPPQAHQRGLSRQQPPAAQDRACSSTSCASTWAGIEGADGRPPWPVKLARKPKGPVR